MIPDRRLREANYGDLSRRPVADFKGKDQMLNYVEVPFPNGESLEDVEKRVKDFLNEVSGKYQGKNIAVVAHQAPQLALDVLVKGKTWSRR